VSIAKCLQSRSNAEPPGDQIPSAIFSGKKPKHDLPVNIPPTKPKQAELRTAPLEWEENEDAVLHELVQDYPYNWTLISDLFNSSRITISTDERSPWDCYDRWNHKFGPASKDAETTAAITAAVDGTKAAVKTAVDGAAGNAGTAGTTGTTPGAIPTPTAPTPSNGATSANGEPQPPLSPGAQRRDAKAAKLAKFEGSKKKVRIMCLREAMRRIQKRRDLVNKKPASRC
jgi:chromatin modification-related protein VID21